MVNMYVIKKWTAFTLVGIAPCLAFYIMMVFYKNILYSLSAMAITMVVFMLAGFMLIKNPFTSMLEGKGLLVFTIDSTGVIDPFLMNINQPMIQTVRHGKEIEDTYDRNSVFSFSPPAVEKKLSFFDKWLGKKSNPIASATQEQIIEDDKTKNMINISLDIDEFNKRRFGMIQYPVLIYSGQLGRCITKDMLSENEKGAFIEHNLLYQNRKLEELNHLMRDFGRYVIEQLNIKSNNIFQSKWFWIIVVVFVVILIALFATPVIQSIMGTVKGASSGVSNVVNAPVTPRV